MRNLVFAKFGTHVSLRDLNGAYSSFGRSFDTHRCAVAHKKTLEKGGYITRLINYKYNEVVVTADGSAVVAGALPHETGWLVTAK